MNKKKIVGIVLAVSIMVTMVSPTFACTPPLNPPSSPHIEINWEPSDELKEAIRLWVKKKLEENPIILETDKETETEETNMEAKNLTEIESESETEFETVVDTSNGESIMETEIESEDVNNIDDIDSGVMNNSLSETDSSDNSKPNILENTTNKNSTDIIYEKETKDIKNTDVNVVKNNNTVIISSPSTIPDTSIKHLNKKLSVREKENITLKDIKPVEETHKIVVLDKLINWRNRVKGWFVTFRK